MPIRHGSNLFKNITRSSVFRVFFQSVFPCSSKACRCIMFFAKSRPIVEGFLTVDSLTAWLMVGISLCSLLNLPGQRLLCKVPRWFRFWQTASPYHYFHREVANRQQKRIARYIREACLPVGKTLDTFDFKAGQSVNAAQITAVANNNDWVKQGSNLVFLVPPA